MDKPDILIFLSDQHHANYAGVMGETSIRTPNIDQLAKDGVVFDNAYTGCPLCVPARSSFLSGQLPSKNGVFDNEGCLAGDQATFIHSLAASGYETVLCGRMHFLGEDQRHGFTKRIFGEFTPLFWGRSGEARKDLGPYVGKCSEPGCLDIIGGGNSPVLEYDRAVIQAAKGYLSQRHDKPQCVVVGTYGPHFVYVSPPELYKYYQGIVGIPRHNQRNTNYSHPLLEAKRREVDDERIVKARAAYYGMIETLDTHLGDLRTQWDDYLARSQRTGVFLYVSDHGDQAGEHHMFGKQTFYEGSAKIPLIFQGSGMVRNQRIKGCVSFMDIGPTLCDLVGATVLPEQDGKSLIHQITTGEDDEPDRAVFSEFMDSTSEGDYVLGAMVRQREWKLVSYSQFESNDLLFNLTDDPFETTNLTAIYPDKYRELKELLVSRSNPEAAISQYVNKQQYRQILGEWGRNSDVAEEERWVVPANATYLPEY
ncbi:sulfatase-like hydrolase/transferase [Alicyclobacillus mengziensis]|uniref:Sulfatase-like hydrolase/transferase n=1 Tax=Alicyclobacillus mengziensis TaxID=2931921 RepID=A0A9X7VYH9_9BACL|nr:sulfatase-like hydrolase/transferase [Alicyclobacillus mengziensis]QSO47394.1 sulfatase-like hydrolase/transferase [Alicyclobacillus mengziensis]